MATWESRHRLAVLRRGLSSGFGFAAFRRLTSTEWSAFSFLIWCKIQLRKGPDSESRATSLFQPLLAAILEGE